MDEGLVAIITVVITATVTLVVEFGKRRAIRKVKDSYILPVQVPHCDKRNSILLLGLGGTGKTSIIKGLLSNDEADPNERTENFTIYKGDRLSIKENTGKKTDISSRFWFYIADYKGQNIGQLVRSFIVQQKKPFSPLAYGHVTSLILMVDLIAPKKEDHHEDIKKQESYDTERVKKHSDEWNDTSLDAIFGLLTSELRYVSIFINKVDLMSDRSYDAEQCYTNLFKDIHEKVKKRSGRATVKTYLGSAKDGTSLNYLVEDLMEYSVHNKPFEEHAHA